MKLILPILLMLSLLWITKSAMAKELDPPGCNDVQACFSETQAIISHESDAHLNSMNQVSVTDNEMNVQDYPQHASNTTLAALPKEFNTGGERAFVFSPRLKEWAAYDNDGYKVAGGVANGGSNYCADLGKPCHSPVGTHRVYSKGSIDCVSNKFPIGEGGAPMPYCMFFNGGYAIHGSPYISNNNTSHGCIRVNTSAAKWLHRYFMTPGTKVIILPY